MKSHRLLVAIALDRAEDRFERLRRKQREGKIVFYDEHREVSNILHSLITELELLERTVPRKDRLN